MDKLTVTKIGTASFEWGDRVLANAYTFVHDMGEPHCDHFNNQHPVDLIQEHENKVSFEKKYTHYFSSVTLNHSVEMASQGFAWKVSRPIQSEQLVPCRYGITLPIDEPDIENKDGAIYLPLINYQQEWRQDFEGQTNIGLPLLKILISGRPAYLAIPFTEDVQFFSFKAEQYFLKISTLNSCDTQLSVFLSFDMAKGFLDFYCDQFPSSRTYVYQFETLSRKIHSKFGIRILSHQNVTKQCNAQPPSEEELDSYIVILENNLNFYPKGFFKWIGLNLISICGHLATDNKILGGFLIRDTILFNASAKSPPVRKAKTIHHELFHMIENKLTPAKRNTLYEMWEKLPTKDKFIEHFMCNSLEDPREYRAELFATFVLDPNFIHNLSDTDPTVKKKFQIIASLFAAINNDCSRIISSHTRSAENTMTRMVTTVPKEEIQTPQKDWHLCGIKHSCFEALDLDGIRIRSLKDIPSGNIAYITLNPLDYCAIEYVNYKTPVEDSLEIWINIHNRIEQADHVLRLKTEDILKADIMVIERFLAGAGIAFDVKRIWDIKDELRIVPLNTIPMLKNTWDLFRNSPIIARIGYNNISFED